MNSVIDLEAQQVAQAAPRADVGGAETHEMDTLGPPICIVASSLRSVSTGQDINDEAHLVVSQAEGSGGSDDIHEINIEVCNSDDIGGTTSHRLTQAEAQTPVVSNPTLDSDPRNTTSDSESDQQPEEPPEEPRMIGDFDGSANEFWKLYTDEAKSDDGARINTLKEGMDSALIFAGLFSAALTAFVVDSKQNLKPSPAEETIYYLRQHSAILSQISLQLSSIAPQVVIPSIPPPPFPSSSPLASDVRVNIFWFMALAFSLLAALLAILVQQWVRNYMHVFQRYGDPLKSSRLRQYLYEGCERWYMRRVAEVVPGFLHISLFLFFAGLGDSLININTKVALTTIVPIGVSGLLYILMTFAPIIRPQSPYQNSFSGIFWYLFQKLRGRRFRDRGSDGEMKSASTNMAQGQMQLAMEETEARKDRDERAIRWLIVNLTEDAEMEKFLSAIPGSFNTDWGTEVWKRVGTHQESGDQSQDGPIARPHRDITAHQSSSSCSIYSILRPIIHLVRRPTPRHSLTHAMTRTPGRHLPNVHPHSTTVHIQGENVVHELSTRIARSVAIYNNRNLFSNDDDLWRKRTRACIEATASLVCCVDAKLAWFEGISKLLGDIGRFEKIRELSLAGTDELFVMRWTCLSLVAVRQILAENQHVSTYLRLTMTSFAKEDDTGNYNTLAGAQKIDETFEKAGRCLFELVAQLRIIRELTEGLTEELTELKEFLHGNESLISELEQINVEADRFRELDHWIYMVQRVINDGSHSIISQIPGSLDDSDPDYDASIPFSRLAQLSPRKLQFIRPSETLKSICSLAPSLRNILEGQADVDAYKEVLKNLQGDLYSQMFNATRYTEQLLLRMQDLRDGGGLGVTVELFFLALLQLLSTSSSKESHSALYTGTFRTITSDWEKHKHSLGTQKLLLEFTMSHRWEINAYCPAYIVNEFLLLLGNICEGQTGPHIELAREEFRSPQWYSPGFGETRERALRVLTRGQARSLAS